MSLAFWAARCLSISASLSTSFSLLLPRLWRCLREVSESLLELDEEDLDHFL